MGQTTIHQNITPGDVLAMATVVSLVTGGKRIKWVDEDVSSDIRSGTARHFVKGLEPQEWSFPDWRHTDIRDSFVRITTSTGLDFAMPFEKFFNLSRNTLLMEDK